MNKTTLKARCGTEIRKNWIHHNNDMSMNDLVAKMQRYFSIGDPAAIKLKYRDEEKEWVTLTDDDELAYALTTMREQLYVEVIGADNAVGDSAAVHTEVKTEQKELAKMAQKESPATPLSSIGELTEIPLSLLLGIPPAVPTESWEEYEQPPQVDLVQLLHSICDDPETVRGVADEIIAFFNKTDTVLD